MPAPYNEIDDYFESPSHMKGYSPSWGKKGPGLAQDDVVDFGEPPWRALPSLGSGGGMGWGASGGLGIGEGEGKGIDM